MKRLIAVLCVCIMLCGCTPQTETENIPVSGETGKRASVVYFEQDDGYLVPVIDYEDWNDRLLSNLMSRMVSGADTDFTLEENGLSALLPKDTKVSATVDEGLATINIESGRLGDMSEKRSKNVLAAAVNTATQIASVDKVRLQVNGKSDRLGTCDISETFASADINPAYAKDDGFVNITSYFKTADSGLMVPVTKYAPRADVETVVKALMKNPDSKNLLTLMPDNVRLNSAKLDEGGTAAIDFSGEILELKKSPDKEQKFFAGLTEALKQLDGVNKIVVTADGEPYEDATQQTASVFANELESYD